MAIQDYGPALNGVDWFLSTVTALCIALRIYSKAVRHLSLWWDDYVLIAAWLCVVAVSIIDTYLIRLGYGKHIAVVPPSSISPIANWSGIATMTVVVALSLSKTSFAVTLLRLAQGQTKWLLWFIIVSLNSVMLLNVVIPLVRCTPVLRSWNPAISGKCYFEEQFGYVIFSGAYSGAMDFLLAILPWAAILNMGMKTTEKLHVAIAMSMGIFAGSAAIVKTVKLQLLLANDYADDTFSTAEIDIWAITEAGVTILCSSVPVLRVLLSKDASDSLHQTAAMSSSESLQKQYIVKSSTLNLDTFDQDIERIQRSTV